MSQQFGQGDIRQEFNSNKYIKSTNDVKQKEIYIDNEHQRDKPVLAQSMTRLQSTSSSGQRKSDLKSSENSNARFNVITKFAFATSCGH